MKQKVTLKFGELDLLVPHLLALAKYEALIQKVNDLYLLQDDKELLISAIDSLVEFVNGHPKCMDEPKD